MSIVIRIKTRVKIGLHEVIGKLFDEIQNKPSYKS